MEHREPAVASGREPEDLLRYVDDLRHAITERVSHELRTPLTVVLGVAEVIHRNADEIRPDQLRTLTERLQAQAHQLELLLDDLLDLDRLARSILEPVREEVDVGAVVTRAATAVPVGRREVVLDVVPVRASVDVARVTRLVENLIANVRQHTPEGTRAVVRVRPADGSVLIEVVDDGPGLDPSIVDEVFEPFVQGLARHTDRPGMGIGLALVRRYAELHGGRVWLGDVERGTSIRVLLPSERRRSRSEATFRRSARPRLAPEPTDAEVPLAPRPDATVSHVLETLRQGTGVDAVYLSEFRQGRQVILAVAGDGGPLGLDAGVEFDYRDSVCVPVVEGRLPPVMTDVGEVPGAEELAAKHPRLVAYVGAPVRLPDGALFGTICAVTATAESVPVTPDTERLLTNGAALLTHHLANRRERIAETSELADRIRTVLLRRQVRSHLQAIVDLRDGRVVGAEALARFPDARTRPPSTWFADADRVGLGRELERAALLSAADVLPLLPAGTYLSCNASPALVASGWLEQLAERVPPDRLVIEVTEHAAVADYAPLMKALESLRDRGARLAVDDVGAGFSSLRHVLDLDPDLIKVDRSLVAGASQDPAQRAMLAGLVSFADEVNARIVAEGIDTTDDLDAIRRCGVALGQGFLFARPSADAVPVTVALPDA